MESHDTTEAIQQSGAQPTETLLKSSLSSYHRRKREQEAHPSGQQWAFSAGWKATARRSQDQHNQWERPPRECSFTLTKEDQTAHRPDNRWALNKGFSACLLYGNGFLSQPSWPQSAYVSACFGCDMPAVIVIVWCCVLYLASPLSIYGALTMCSVIVVIADAVYYARTAVDNSWVTIGKHCTHWLAFHRTWSTLSEM